MPGFTLSGLFYCQSTNNHSMNKFLLICLLAGMASCTGTNNSNSARVEDEVADNIETSKKSICGQWQIENIVENDSSYVRPSEIEGGTRAYIDFREDKTFGVMTNCNHLGGEYFQYGDSISLTDISATEMACDNMEIEDMLKKVLPLVNALDCINDSVIRLNSSKAEAYIVLKRSESSLK